jgi:hypothetical protein
MMAVCCCSISGGLDDDDLHHAVGGKVGKHDDAGDGDDN